MLLKGVAASLCRGCSVIPCAMYTEPPYSKSARLVTQRSPLRLVALPLALILILALVGTAPQVGALAAADTPSPTTQLLLLSPSTAQIGLLDRLPITVRGVISTKPADRYVVSGPRSARRWIEAAGIPVELLDEDTAGHVYYFVQMRADADRRAVANYGRVIYDSGAELLLAVPQANERRLVEEAPARGVAIALLSPDPIASCERTRPSLPTARGAEADPVVVALLPQLTENRLADLIAGLSGERPVTVRRSQCDLRDSLYLRRPNRGRYPISLPILCPARPPCQLHRLGLRRLQRPQRGGRHPWGQPPGAHLAGGWALRRHLRQPLHARARRG